MNLKVKALAITAGLIVAAGVVAELLRAVASYFTTDQLTTIISVGFIAWMVYCLYRLMLCRLEYTEEVNKINAKYADQKVDQ